MTILSLVFHNNGGFAVLFLDAEWPVLHVANDVLVIHLATDEALGVKDSVFGVRVEGVFGAVADTA
jgi:hypothetical protein